ncbi:anillin-like [Centruroides vittatus]|uniref:anillin-like n=1 Tax=Centruroides vittatus TaxID=120091 RepID=UPI003510C92D
MELDPFTKKLLARTQARRENLSKMETNTTGAAVRKRRVPMSEKTNADFSDDNLKTQSSSKESPKRPCLQADEINNENNEDLTTVNEVESKIENKENIDKMEIELQQENFSSKERNLDKDKKSADDFPASNNELHEESITQARSSCKKRLAALAARINQWEDDFTYHSSSERFVSKPSTNDSHTNSVVSKNNTFTNHSKKSNINTVHIEQNNNNNSCRETSSEDSNVSNKISSLNGGGNQILKSIIKKDKNHSQQVRKVVVWDHAILETLECQGFTKSPSTTKLQYEFSSNSSKKTAESILESKEEKLHSVPDLKTNKNNNNSNKLISSRNEEQPAENVYSKDIDPAELPLTARRALFEKAFIHGNNRSCENPEKLSVAERAALFEKSSGLCNAKSSNFQSFNQKKQNESSFSQKSEISSNNSSLKPVSSVKSSTELPINSSPSKIGNHTRKVQHQLLSSKDKSWQHNEISMKTKIERQNEMAVLLNRWERASSKTKTENSNQKNMQMKSPIRCNQPINEDINYPISSLSTINDTEEISEDDDEIQQSENNSEEEMYEYEEEEEEEEEQQEEQEQQHTEEEKIYEENIKNNSNLNESEMVNEAVAICEEIDELLDDALSDCESSSSTESLVPVKQSANPEVTQTPVKPSVLNKPMQNNKTPISSSVAESSTVVSKPITSSATASKPEDFLPKSIIDNGEEVPLLHTISFYRRKKQGQQLLTPVKKIVRREEVHSPPSPDEESRIATLQQKIKCLQEEILSQQTIISQATQALNLCHATTEFFGSTEQVEGERLLLIATQKRQAYLNEIQRLKTDGALRKNSENGMGTLTLTDISLGIKREFLTAQAEGRLDNNVHYFICLIRYGAQLIATQMLSTDGISGNTLNYTNYITLQELQSDFCVSFEVFALQTKKEMIPHDKKYHIKKEHSKLRITPKAKKDSKLMSPAITSPGGPNAVRTPSFALIGFTRLCLTNCNKSSYVLEKVPYQSPLEGNVYMKVQLHAEHRIEERGFLTMFEDVSGFGAWHRRWCILKGNNLAYWKYPEDDKKKAPIGTIDLRHCVTPLVKLVSRDICARPHTFQLISMRPKEEDDRDTLISQSVNTITTTKHLLSADTKEERILWCNRLNEVLSSIRKWDPEALRPIEIAQ